MFDGILLLIQYLDCSPGFSLLSFSRFPQFLHPWPVCLPQLPATADQQTTINPEGRSHRQQGRLCRDWHISLPSGPIGVPAGAVRTAQAAPLCCRTQATWGPLCPTLSLCQGSSRLLLFFWERSPLIYKMLETLSLKMLFSSIH